MPTTERRAIPPQLITVSAAGCVLASGLLLSFYPTLQSGFGAMQVEPLDTPLINYILEHSYLWLTGDPLHHAFWSPPVFHPATNTAAYSETFLGVAPLYWLFRAVGLLPDTSYQLWLIAISALNYVVALLFLRHVFSLSLAGSAAGAWLIAFGSPRTQQLIHAQLIPVFYVLVAIYCLRRVLAEPTRRGRFIAIFFAAVALQLYTSVYIGWFFLFGLGIAFVMVLFFAGGRSRMGAVLREQYVALLASALLWALSIAPMLLHYLEATRARGYRDFVEVSPMLVRPQSWLYMGPLNWLYGGLADLAPFAALPMEHEHRLGVGLITAAAAIFGLYTVRRNPFLGCVVTTVVLMSAVSLVMPGGGTAWQFVFDTVPGAAALRAVSRIGMFALIPLGIGLAVLVDRLASARRWLATALVVTAVFVEQGASLPHYDKLDHRRQVTRLTGRIPATSDAFLYVAGYGDAFWQGQVKAMWAGTQAGKPTVNGYSGNVPPGWTFFENVVNDDQRLDDELATWATLHDIELGEIVVVPVR